MWLILAAILVSGGNAMVRKAFSMSSNALLEVQWYLFSAVFLLGAGYTFLKNAHVRIDFVSSRLSARSRSWVDIFGILLILAPMCWIVIKLSWPLFFKAWQSGISGIHYNIADYYQTFDKMEKICDHVLPGHDPLVFAHQTYPY